MAAALIYPKFNQTQGNNSNCVVQLLRVEICRTTCPTQSKFLGAGARTDSKLNCSATIRYWPKGDMRVIINAIGFLLAAAFGAWLLWFVLSAIRTGHIHHTDSTSTYSFRKQPIRFLFVAIVFIAFASIAFYFATDRWQSFWGIDKCLDRGGTWIDQVERCVYSTE